MGPLKYEIAARGHLHLVSRKVDQLQDVDARGAPGDLFNGHLRCGENTVDFISHAPDQHESPHFPVGDQGPKGILKSRRSVPLDEEMASPGKSVTDER
jgi:hypothetical protein